MGTIAELLGFDLSEPTPPGDGEGDAAPVDEGGAAALPEAGAEEGAPGPDTAATPTSDEVVLEAVLAETSLDPSDAREDLTLTGDLDLDTIGRYAVTTSVERGLGVQFRDAGIDALETLGDLLVLARGAAAS
ncbi:hypothetical protein [Actinomyces polynesiensis]|uniref:hypothetical protein n=1 Tax=Actinomyces polynesiensis TaxID=1325934 RepID=UPI00069440A6|nr:hypothetical protein [Actinomyces polynesiensis]